MEIIKQKFIILVLFLVAVGTLGPALINDAQALSLMEGVSESCWSQKEGKGIDMGDCTVCDVLRVFFNGARFIFLSMSGIALIMIIWAAIGLIMNWGSAEAVGKNKKLIMHTLLGILIVMLSWTLVNAIGWFFLGATSTGLQESGQEQKVWEKGWWTGPTCD